MTGKIPLLLQILEKNNKYQIRNILVTVATDFRANFIATLGGILGLCLGASLISLVEVVWYFLVGVYTVARGN